MRLMSPGLQQRGAPTIAPRRPIALLLHCPTKPPTMSDRAAKLRDGLSTAKTLAEALPYIQIYDRETVVVKYGGAAMGEATTAPQFAADIVLLKLVGIHPVVVHGGGPQINRMLDRAGV